MQFCKLNGMSSTNATPKPDPSNGRAGVTKTLGMPKLGLEGFELAWIIARMVR